MAVTPRVQIKRRLTGAAGPPTGLLDGELAYNRDGDALYVGVSGAGRELVSTTNFVNVASPQAITGRKTFSPGPTGSLSITGGAADNILITDGNGNVSWSAGVPGGGGITQIHVDGTTIQGDGLATASALHVGDIDCGTF